MIFFYVEEIEKREKYHSSLKMQKHFMIRCKNTYIHPFEVRLKVVDRVS